MSAVDWESFPLEKLVAELREKPISADGEKMVWAFEHAVRVARVDESLLDYVLVAVVCLLARTTGSSPRTVLELYFRRAVGDDEWRRDFLPLFS